jgi:hypothetical protein
MPMKRTGVGVALASAGFVACTAIFGDSGVSSTPPVGPDANPDAPINDAPAEAHSVSDTGAADRPVADMGAVDTGVADTAVSDMTTEANPCPGKDLTRDVLDCGACGHDCNALPNVASATCAAGQCQATMCMLGYAHCTSNPDDGCETDLAQPGNCGGCANACAAPAPLCAPSATDSGGLAYGCAGVCPAIAPTSCNGSCVNLTSDPKNCVACASACPAPTGSVATCAMGACGYTCNAGFHKCATACASDRDPVTCGTSCNTPCAAPMGGVATCDGMSCGTRCISATATVCGTTCLELGTDSNNCGACGHACLAGACAGGLCAPTVLSTTEDYPSAIAADSQNLYWANQTAVIQATNTGDGRVELAPGNAISSIAVDSSYVYWDNYIGGAGGSIQRIPIGGGSPTTIYPTSTAPYPIAVDATGLYFLVAGATYSLYRTNKDGSCTLPSCVIASGQSGGERWVTSNGTYVFWGTSSGLFRVTTGGTGLSPLTTTAVNGIAADASFVYWTDSASVNKMPVGGGSITQLATGGTLTDPIAVDANYVYWADQSANTVSRVSIGGGKPLVLARAQNRPWALAIDSSYVYWLNPGDIGSNNGQVVKVAK